jgi:hypothetical protein
MLPLPSRHLRPINHFGRNPTHSRAVHTETALRNAIFKFIQECDLAIIIVDMDLHPLGRDLGMARKLGGQGMVVRCEETCAADVGGDVVEDGLGDGDAVIGGSPAAELV